MNRSRIRHPNEPSITLSYTSRKGMTYKRIPYLLRHPSTSSETFPTPQFVELVETNPVVTSAFAPHPRPFDKLKDLPRLPPQFVEPALC